MNEDEVIILKTYIQISSYRERVLRTIGNGVKTPTQIAKDSGITPNHISNVLNQLKTKDLAVCINEPVRKGRLYKLTPKGVKILNQIEN